jgi:hypothetical protein
MEVEGLSFLEQRRLWRFLQTQFSETAVRGTKQMVEH